MLCNGHCIRLWIWLQFKFNVTLCICYTLWIWWKEQFKALYMTTINLKVSRQCNDQKTENPSYRTLRCRNGTWAWHPNLYCALWFWFCVYNITFHFSIQFRNSQPLYFVSEIDSEMFVVKCDWCLLHAQNSERLNEIPNPILGFRQHELYITHISDSMKHFNWRMHFHFVAFDSMECEPDTLSSENIHKIQCADLKWVKVDVITI